MVIINIQVHKLIIIKINRKKDAVVKDIEKWLSVKVSFQTNCNW